MLSAKNVFKSFGQIHALIDVSFDVADGEFVFITGPSGAGKTTLLKLLTREHIPDKGTISFDGVNLATLKEGDVSRLRQKIGFVFQDFKLLHERTIRENIEVALAVTGVAAEKWKEKIGYVLDTCGLSERGDLFPSQLSGGEMQRASLARALAVNPKLILADEPTGNLDWQTAESIVDLFAKINKEGRTIIMATHNELVVNKLKKRTIVLSAGKIISDTKKK